MVFLKHSHNTFKWKQLDNVSKRLMWRDELLFMHNRAWSNYTGKVDLELQGSASYPSQQGKEGKGIGSVKMTKTMISFDAHPQINHQSRNN